MPNLLVALVQLDILWQQPEENRKKIDRLLSSVSVDLIVLPEMFTTGFTMQAAENAEMMDGETVEWMRQLAKNKNAVVTGSLIICDQSDYYNRLIWMNPDGSYTYYDKRHLFRMAGEDEHYREGGSKIFPIVKGWRICPLICYDLRFPVWSRNQNNYDLLIYVANWPKARELAWKSLAKARAIENLSPVVFVNRTGSDNNGVEYSGGSMAYDEKGNELIDSVEEERVVTFQLNFNQLKEFRNKFPAHLDADSFAIQE